MDEQEILDLISKDVQMMSVLSRAESLDLNDWLIGAGFVRNKVWNHLSGRVTQNLDATDIDMVYFDSTIPNDYEKDVDLMEKLEKETGLDWEIRNNAYKYKTTDRSDYSSAEDVISSWPETVTAIGVKLENGGLKLIAPYGISDLVNFRVRPSPKYKDGVERIKERMAKKGWLEKWPNLKIEL